MSIYAPKGVFKDEVIDPDKISEEWSRAKRVIDNATHWQFNRGPGSLTYDTLAEDGAGVQVLQKQRSGYVGAGVDKNKDGDYLRTYGYGVKNFMPWLIPYLKGFQEVWDGNMALEWTSSSSELVLVGCSMWAYRLSSEHENQNNEVDGEYAEYTNSNWFGLETMIRTRLGLKLDGTVIEGSGPGTNVATNNPETVVGAGSQQKGIVFSSQSVHLLRAGTHRLTPVAGQGPAVVHPGQLSGDYWLSKGMKYFDNLTQAGATGTLHVFGGDPAEANTGVGVVNCRVHAIRFPRGKMLGS